MKDDAMIVPLESHPGLNCLPNTSCRIAQLDDLQVTTLNCHVSLWGIRQRFPQPAHVSHSLKDNMT